MHEESVSVEETTQWSLRFSAQKVKDRDNSEKTVIFVAHHDVGHATSLEIANA